MLAVLDYVKQVVQLAVLETVQERVRDVQVVQMLVQHGAVLVAEEPVQVVAKLARRRALTDAVDHVIMEIALGLV